MFSSIFRFDIIISSSLTVATWCCVPCNDSSCIIWLVSAAESQMTCQILVATKKHSEESKLVEMNGSLAVWWQYVTMMEIWSNQIIFQDVCTHLDVSDCGNSTTWKLVWLIHLCTAPVPPPRHCCLVFAGILYAVCIFLDL